MTNVGYGRVRLIIPALVLVVVLLGAPLAMIADESLRVYVPGHVGAAVGAKLTADNYLDLATPGYAGFFLDTFVLSGAAAFIALVLGFPIAYTIVHRASPAARQAWFVLLVSLLLLSILVRTYALALAAGPAGFGRNMSALVGLALNSKGYAEITVVAGLLHCTLPMVILALLAPLQTLSPRLVDAAEALGATRWWAHVSITLPLAGRALAAAFIVAFTFCISAFVIPMVLGKGRVLFVANLIYSRFGEIGDYPSGAAFAIVLLAASAAVIAGIGRLSGRPWSR